MPAYRFRAASIRTLRLLAVDLGWLRHNPEQSANGVVMPESWSCLSSFDCWDEIGIVKNPTGSIFTVGGVEVPETYVVSAPDGTPYLHVNFLWKVPCEIDPADGQPKKWSLLLQHAQACAEAKPEAAPRIMAALQDIGLVCITDDGATARDPKNPVRVF